MKQKTFMMLKPDAFEHHQEEAILQDLRAHGLRILRSNVVEIDMDVMKTLLEHYKFVIDEQGKDFNFPGKLFTSFYFDGPHYLMPMEIEYDGEEDIITFTRMLVGKTNPEAADNESIRGKYSDDNYTKAAAEKRLVKNVIHASDAAESAQRELLIWEVYL